LTYSLRHASWLEPRVRRESAPKTELAPPTLARAWTVYSYVRTSFFYYQRVE